MDQRKNPRALLYTAAGLYLLYLAYKLFQGNGTQEGTEKIIGMAAMIAFAVIGAGLAYFGLRSGIARWKDTGAEEPEEAEIEEPAEAASEEPEPEEPAEAASEEPEPEEPAEAASEESEPEAPAEAGEDSEHD